MPAVQPLPRPTFDSPKLGDLFKRLVPGGTPLPVQVIKPPPWAEPNECVANVASVIEIYGGATELGWQLWETLPGVLIEAEFHAVWIDKEGDRLDVTPNAIPGAARINFLPDPKLLDNGRQIDNVRISLVDDPLVNDLIKSHEAFFEATNRGELADSDEFVMTPEIEAIESRGMRLEAAIVSKYYAH